MAEQVWGCTQHLGIGSARGRRRRNERKRTEYKHLVIDLREQGWKAKCMPIEVGCRGLVGQSLHRALSVLGVTGGARTRAIKNITETDIYQI